MLRRFTNIIFLLVLVAVLFLPSVSLAEDPVVDIYLLYSETCPHCHVVRTEVLPPIQEKFGDQLNVIPLNLSVPDDFKTGLVLEAIYQVPPEQAGVPEIFVGKSVLIGSNSISDYLEEEVQTLLDEGGFRMPTQQQLLDMIVWEEQPTEESTQPLTDTLKAPVYTPGQVLETLEAPSAEPVTVPASTPSLGRPKNTPASGSPTVPGLTPTSVLTYSEPARTATAANPSASEPTRAPSAAGEIAATAALPAVSPTPATAVALNMGSGAPLRMAYFYEVGCNECDRAQYVLNYLQQTDYPNLAIDEFDVVEQAGLAKWLGEKYGLTESELLATPVVFVGDDYLLESDITVQKLVPILDKYQAAGTEAAWDQYESGESANAVLGLFQNISMAAVIGAGLVDGVNPCAFATIVFFVAYLAFIGRRGRDLILTGIAFTLGVFVAYLLLGLGLLKILQVIDITSWGRYFYILVAVLCLILAVVNLTDFFKARQGKVEKMQLKLPTSMRRHINRVIREGSGVRAFVIVSFVTGFVVSVIELACTGQVYVVILSALSHPTLRGQALSYLIIYNIAFVVPLVIVFLLAFFGVSSGDLARVVERHTATVKLLTALLFLGMSLWLIYAFLPLFGVRVLGS